VTIGIARTKFLAKVASGVAKPDGLLVVPPDGERAFLHPLPVERIWGVGPATAARLNGCGIATVGQLAIASEPGLESLLGRAAARHLYALANNRDPRVVRARPRRRSIGSQHARGRARASPEQVDADLIALVDRVMRRVRAAHRVGRTVILRLRFADYARATRSHTMPRPTARTSVVLVVALVLLAGAQPLIDERGLTLIGVALTNLGEDLPFQLELPFVPDPGESLDAALDEIKDRFGTYAVMRGVTLGRSDLTMPLLPD
jgi:DNA polymerase-4